MTQFYPVTSEMFSAATPRSAGSQPQPEQQPTNEDAPSAFVPVTPEHFGGSPATAPQSQSDAPSYDTSYWKGVTRSIASGVTFGFADEAESYLRTLSGGDREMALANIRDEMDRFQKANPKVALTSEMIGAIALPGLGAAKAMTAAARAGITSLGGRVATSAGIGTAEGALSGAGHAENDKAEGAKWGAGVGAGFGGAIPVAGHIATPILESLGSRIPGIASKVAERRATREIAGAVEADAQLAGTNAGAELSRIRSTEQSAQGIDGLGSLASEGGESVRRLASDASRETATAQRSLRNYRGEVDAARPSAEFDALYHGKDIVSPSIEKLIVSRPSIREAAATAENALADMGIATNAGRFSRQQLHEIDSALATKISETHGKAQLPLLAAQTELRAVTSKLFPELAPVQREYAKGSRMLRNAPQEAEVAATDQTARHVANAAGAAFDLVRGHHATLLRRVAGWIGGGEQAKAEVITRAMLTRFNQPGELAKVLNSLEALDPRARQATLKAAMSVWSAAGAGSTKIGGDVGATR